MTITVSQFTVIVVALFRLAELIHARRNTVLLIARGGVEYGQSHYPFFIILHGSWLLSLLFVVPANAASHMPLLTVFVALQFCRIWVIITLGPYWTTRIITAPTFPLVTRGPYKFMKHPNYAIVCAEIAILPLAFGAWKLALLYSALNIVLISWRVRVESEALKIRT